MVNFMRSAAGRVLGLALVMMLVMSVVGLAASQTFINKTGKTVTGITITFSKDVRITRHDAVFPDQSPSGRSDEFTFDGGSLRNLGRFTVYWTPSSGKVMDYEWTTKQVLARTTSLSTSAPSFDRIMAKIAQYPGPDELLYQPQPNEQIWLTDLDGHGSIYDNDSIKINYALGFDKSQITKIDVYRNGIRMRFLPDMFDVLTNVQMKTFDGNPLERTPKSAHTDHAIYGYSYQFRFCNRNGEIVRKLQVNIKSPFHFSGKAFIYIGHNFQRRMSVSDSELVATLQSLKEAGFTGVQLGTYYFSKSLTSNSLFAQYKPDPSVGWFTTPKESDIRRMLRLTKIAGLESELRVEVWLCEDWSHAHRGVNREALNPQNVDEWFSNYTNLCLKNARIAEEEGADVLCIGVELCSMEQYTQQWKDLVSRVRGVFSGKVTYAQASQFPLIDFRNNSNSNQLKENLGSFWAPFDYIEMTCWSPPIGTSRDQRLSLLLEKFIALWEPAFSTFKIAFPLLGVSFGEMGVWQHDGASMGYDPTASIEDRQEFTDIWATYLAATEYLGASSVAVWDYELVGGGSGLGRVSLNGTPAWRTIVSILGGVLTGVEPTLLASPPAIPAWNEVPWIESYAKNVRPSKYWTTLGQRPVQDGKNWGLAGSDLKGVKIISAESGTFIHLETYSRSLPGQYTYVLHLRPPGGRDILLMISLDPKSASAHLSENVGDLWYGLDSIIEMVEITKNSITAYLPRVLLPSGSSTDDIVDWEPVSLLLYRTSDKQNEYYELPHTNVAD